MPPCCQTATVFVSGTGSEMSCLQRSLGVTPGSQAKKVRACERESDQDTYGENWQCHLAVHPHVALHLPLQMFLGGELMRRHAVTGGGRGVGVGDKRYHERSIIQSDANVYRPSGRPGSGVLSRALRSNGRADKKKISFIHFLVHLRPSVLHFFHLFRRLGTNSPFIATLPPVERAPYSDGLVIKGRC